MMKYSTYTWDLVQALSQDSLPPARHQPHFMIPSAKAINQKKAKNPEMRFNSQQIVSYCIGLCTQNLGLREVDLEPSQKTKRDSEVVTRSTCSNKAEKLQKKHFHG